MKLKKIETILASLVLVVLLCNYLEVSFPYATVFRVIVGMLMALFYFFFAPFLLFDKDVNILSTIRHRMSAEYVADIISFSVEPKNIWQTPQFDLFVTYLLSYAMAAACLYLGFESISPDKIKSVSIIIASAGILIIVLPMLVKNRDYYPAWKSMCVRIAIMLLYAYTILDKYDFI
ncbi:MAG: hypothetical protein IKR17_05100 [Bacteroidales bacterium]|nr:hypothetical protein [Bacteroidales bacterium]